MLDKNVVFVCVCLDCMMGGEQNLKYADNTNGETVHIFYQVRMQCSGGLDIFLL